MVKYSEITVRQALTKSRIPGVDYCLNPYRGCSHACRYCYADFMKRFTGHTEPWGAFVDIKTNIPEALAAEIKRVKQGHIMIASVTDAYQPVEGSRRLTRRCLEVLLPHAGRISVGILTKSPLVLRDMDLIKQFPDIEVGLSVTTDDEGIRKAFEPLAPPIGARVRALKALREAGVKTYAFIGPVLPMDTEKLAAMLKGHIEYAYIDRMNYSAKTRALYKRLGLTRWLDEGFALDNCRRLAGLLGRKAIRIFE